MINKATLAVVAAVLVGTATNAFASAMDNDPNTGLWSYLYYGPISDLHQKGLPISQGAVNYMNQHRTAVPGTAAKRGNGVYLLEDTQGIVAPRRQAPAYPAYNNDFQSGHMW
jgi:hypothetical protein